MDASKKEKVQQHVAGILDEVDWDNATRDALVNLIDLVQKWILPTLKKATGSLGTIIEFGLQSAEDFVRNKKTPTPGPAPAPAPKPPVK